MVTTRHTRDGALNTLRDGIFIGAIGYTNNHSTVGVISQDEAVDFLVEDGYNRKYANRVLSNAYVRGRVTRLTRGLYLLDLIN